MEKKNQSAIEGAQATILPKAQTQNSSSNIKGEKKNHAYGAPEGVTDKEVEQAVVEVNPDVSSLDRG